ncbi:MAG: rhodanese-like domain-containing protein [Ignavibacteria bacterium]|nr:rhodanese-like domain-containing protein [Ignavibacteria bacterium]
MLKKYYSILSIVLLLLFVISCSEDTSEPTVPEAEVLAKFLESTESPYGKDYVNTDLPSIVDAATLKTDLEAGKAYVIDVRAAADFAQGRIKGAKNVAISDIVNHIKTVEVSKYDKIVIVCYTGQSAGFCASILRLLGYKNVFSLKFGMCSWHSDFAKRWRDVVAQGNKYAAQFEKTPREKNPLGSMPELKTGKTKGIEILQARVDAVLKDGWTPATITADAVFQNLSNYYIVNYWPEAQYLDPGHIPGAVNYVPKTSLKFDTHLRTLPTNKPIVIYCYTGQTSAFLVAYLRILGYDAKSLLFGANGMIYDLMKQKNMTVFKEEDIKNYEYEK